MTEVVGDPIREFVRQRQTPCLAKLNIQRPWRRTVAVRVGDSLVGIRANTDPTASVLEALFADIRVPEADSLAPPNFSVELSPVAEGAQQGLNLVYRDHNVRARNRDPQELLLDLVELVESTGFGEESGLLAVRAGAVVDARGTVTLLPAEWHQTLVEQQRRLSLSGLGLLPTDTQLIDPQTNSVRSGSAIPNVPGRPPTYLPLRRWAVRVVTESNETLRRAKAIHAAFHNVINLPAIGPDNALHALRDLTSSVTFVGVPAPARKERVAAACSLAAGA